MQNCIFVPFLPLLLKYDTSNCVITKEEYLNLMLVFLLIILLIIIDYFIIDVFVDLPIQSLCKTTGLFWQKMFS